MATLATESLFWVAAVVCVIAQVAIVRGVVVDGAKHQPTAGAAAPPGGTTRAFDKRRRAAEAMWALLPGLVLAAVLVWTWHAVVRAAPHTPATDTRPVVTPAAGA